jgi:hypothetical protein
MRIDPFTPVELSATMKDELTILIHVMEDSLPNQSFAFGKFLFLLIIKGNKI